MLSGAEVRREAVIISPSSRPKHGRAGVDSFSKIVMRMPLKMTMMSIMVMKMMIITALLEGYLFLMDSWPPR